VRWERLFEDLEAQLAADAARELTAEVADRIRRDRAGLAIPERLAGMRGGGPVTFEVAGVDVLRGAVSDVGPDWVLLARSAGQSALVPLAAVLSMVGLSGRAATLSAVTKGFGLGAALRAISRDRSVVTVVDVTGRRRAGTIDVVGADALDLAEHAADVPRRPEHVQSVRTVPFAALAVVLRSQR